MKCSSPNLSTFWISWVTASAHKCVKSAFSGLLADVVQFTSALGQVCISREWYWKEKQTDRIRSDHFILVFHTVKSSSRNLALNELNRIPSIAHQLVRGSVLGTPRTNKNLTLVLPQKAGQSRVDQSLEKCFWGAVFSLTSEVDFPSLTWHNCTNHYLTEEPLLIHPNWKKKCLGGLTLWVKWKMCSEEPLFFQWTKDV